MLKDIFVVHRNCPEASGPLSLSGIEKTDVFHFRTCLRQMVIGSSETTEAYLSDFASGDEVFRGEDAYRFLLEVICGLRSPLVGETEVLGQFKAAVAKFAVLKADSWWAAELTRLVQCLFEDAKSIRQKHLAGLGSQSYGSRLRRQLRRVPEVEAIHLLGSGQLVQEVVPWLRKDGREIHIHCRHPEKVSADLSVGRIHRLQDGQALSASIQALVIAAPVSSKWLREWLRNIQTIAFVADLRGESDADPFNDEPKFQYHLALKEFLSGFEEQKALLAVKKTQALKAVQEAAHRRGHHVEYRPFGWEDVCA